MFFYCLFTCYEIVLMVMILNIIKFNIYWSDLFRSFEQILGVDQRIRTLWKYIKRFEVKYVEYQVYFIYRLFIFLFYGLFLLFFSTYYFNVGSGLRLSRDIMIFW